MNIHLLVLIELAADALSRLERAGFHPHVASNAADLAALKPSLRNRIRAALTNGSTGLSAEHIVALPKLEIICALGAGYENVDLAAAEAGGIAVSNGARTNDACVADHAMALLMAIARGIAQADAAVRRGEWTRSRQPRPTISGKRLGLLGLGNIGMQIAQRATGGFAMAVAYHTRRPREATPYLYMPTPVALAEWCDFLVIATPGGTTTAHLVDADVLQALGPDGFLINIARGSVVDTAALGDALQHGRIAGAALDVIEGEPNVPEPIARLSNVILTPHIAGRSPEAIAATVQLAIDNLSAHFHGLPLPTPVLAPPASGAAGASARMRSSKPPVCTSE
ncbi:2-hydroxyacid dehydrogenase [Xanthomonas hyacinthi]|uniref:2-hydroxyacid dehydrogenase n=1 Tax=Xanthomonas hyacinthi TaxID=56455 RepID=A0A2S7EW33_9XANT|nr:2-hydroxyacid dehydrogenase [Xanthomonas hyacinthi]KLD76695.1 2-hydroxyacid dehydrogenase [Xanthomonas hyacinthi DSM 19077]PPU97285.1 2-hydroxyacid dehydrogenase [Xanthomonas hyacinthi]QGY76424.1 2-hydroxyacid dehydrogenase [Xanthomonas hyacinthi]